MLAVYMPPQLPGPGMAVRSTSSSCGVRDLARRTAADGLEHRHDVAPLGARPDGAAVDEYRRTVQARHAP